MTSIDTAAIRARAEKAAPGPWHPDKRTCYIGDYALVDFSGIAHCLAILLLAGTMLLGMAGTAQASSDFVMPHGYIMGETQPQVPVLSRKSAGPHSDISSKLPLRTSFRFAVLPYRIYGNRPCSECSPKRPVRPEWVIPLGSILGAIFMWVVLKLVDWARK